MAVSLSWYQFWLSAAQIEEADRSCAAADLDIDHQVEIRLK